MLKPAIQSRRIGRVAFRSSCFGPDPDEEALTRVFTVTGVEFSKKIKNYILTGVCEEFDMLLPKEKPPIYDWAVQEGHPIFNRTNEELSDEIHKG